MSIPERDPQVPERLPTQDELPYDDGMPMDTPKHRAQMDLLIDSLELSLRDRPEVYVGGNMGFYFSPIQAKTQDFRAPDFFVVVGALQGRERKSWVVWEEAGRFPNVVIELLSDSTEREDRGRKMRTYAAIGVPEYFLFDPHSLVFEGYRLGAPGTYVPLARTPAGRLPCAELSLELGIAEGTFRRVTTPWLRWWTPAGQMLPSGEDLARTAEARLAEAESWADEQKAIADEQKARADEQKARADAEAARAAEAEARVKAAEARTAELAARLRALGITPEE